MSKSKIEPFQYSGYGCPNTEMWMRRAQFEEQHPDLNCFMKKDAPHYANAKTRIAYSIWEAEYERNNKQKLEEIHALAEFFDDKSQEKLCARKTTCTLEIIEEFSNLPEISKI